MEPLLEEAEVKAVSDVFSGKWIGNGPRVKAFEKKFADYIEASPKEFIATTCCTEGLFQVVSALNFSPSDEIVMPTISFIGAAHSVRSANISIKLTDVNYRTLNPSVKDVEKAITLNTKAIMLLHYGGRAGNVKEIAKLAKDKKILLIEDAACGLGTTDNNISCGNFGDVGVWSFDPMKLLVAGDGGMIRASDEELREKIKLGISLGLEKTGFQSANSKSHKWWEVHPATNGRRALMNDLTAAIGLVQLTRIETFLKIRKKIAQRYNEAFLSIPWIALPPESSSETADYFYWIQVPEAIRNNLAQHLLDRGVYTSFRYWPLHKTNLYATDMKFPGADKAAASTLQLPMHQGLTDADITKIIEVVCSYSF